MSIRFLVTTLAFLAFEVAAQNARPTLIADPKTGCQVWNLYPDPDDSIRWSGACVNGLAEGPGVLQWIVNGREEVRYEGEYRNGKENGRGVTTWAHGSRYEGE